MRNCPGELGLEESDLRRLTLSVQAGFIVGTLTLAVTGLADRFGASRIFLVSSVLGALANAGFVLVAGVFPVDSLLRFATGLCLAGIYPLGMKLVIAWTPKHAGAALAWLVGMLTLGTALPHLMRGATLGLPWEWPLLAASVLALAGSVEPGAASGWRYCCCRARCSDCCRWAEARRQPDTIARFQPPHLLRTAMTPRILLLSAYDAASHQRWRNQLVAMCPDYHWQTLTLPPRFFQWRIRGNPVSWLAEPCLSQPWDLIVATSMVDLATLRGLHPQLATTPCLLYMHENQFAFPVSEQQQGRLEPQMVNLYSALAADAVAFNSAWNRDSFLRGVDALLNKMPDAVLPGVVQALTEKSRVLPVPIEDRLFVDQGRALNWRCPHLLWNHRWEYDKGPDRLLAFLQALEGRSMPFHLSVVGEGFRRYPEAFDQIHQQFAGHIKHWGYVESRDGYDRLLREADIVLSTALHDFQGLAVLEAMASGCVALVPDRLAYREYVPEPCRYRSDESSPEAEARAAADCLEQIMVDKPASTSPDAWRASRLAGRYRALLDDLIAGR